MEPWLVWRVVIGLMPPLSLNLWAIVWFGRKLALCGCKLRCREFLFMWLMPEVAPMQLRPPMG